MQDEGLRGNFIAMINDDEELPPIQDIVKKLMRKSPVFIHRFNSLVRKLILRLTSIDVNFGLLSSHI